MDQKTLILCVGLPRSGKSTWAKSKGYPMVNPDSVRLALYNKPFIPESERITWAITHYMVAALFLAGHHHVILDATNTTKKRRDDWASRKWERIYEVFDASEEVCIERAIKDNRLDLVPVIKGMAERYEPVEKEERL